MFSIITTDWVGSLQSPTEIVSWSGVCWIGSFY